MLVSPSDGFLPEGILQSILEIRSTQMTTDSFGEPWLSTSVHSIRASSSHVCSLFSGHDNVFKTRGYVLTGIHGVEDGLLANAIPNIEPPLAALDVFLGVFGHETLTVQGHDMEAYRRCLVQLSHSHG